MNTDLEMGTRDVDRTSIAQDAPDFNPADAETANRTALSGQQVSPGDAETTNAISIPGPQVAGNDADGASLSLPRAFERIKSAPTRCLLPTDPSFSAWKRTLWKMGFMVIVKREDEGAEGMLKIRILHQYNVLWARSRLLRHYHEPNDIVDDEFAAGTQRDLQTYCKDEVRC